MKKLIVLAAAVAVSLGLGLSALAENAPKEPVKVTNYGKKDAVTFDHSKHSAVKCEQCHHNGLKDPKCGDCHKLDDGEAPKIKDAMHGKKGACYACHYDKGAEHKLKCNDCHKG